MLSLYNSLTLQKDVFKPQHEKEVTLYVCGITPYDTTHLGHAFTYLSFDILVRYLTYLGYEVTYTQNVTDMNDRDNDILKRAKDLGVSWQELATFWTKKFLDDMQQLNWIKPTSYIKASENIPAMIELIQKLLANGLAYEKHGSVYLDITKDKDFGKLSRLTKEQMLSIAQQFEEDTKNPDKKHPLDITLWRATAEKQLPHIPSYSSPFGFGRPGWHIECSAMSIKTLAEQINSRANGERYRTIDIHGGGIDLIYPHHESEIAQSEGATKKIPFVAYWMHTGAVSYKGEKMSKSLGNLVLVSDLLKTYSPNAIRYVLLSHHYRQPWEFTQEMMEDAEEKVSSLAHRLTERQEIPVEIIQALNDDLNTPKVLEELEKQQVVAKEVFSLLGFVLP